MSYCVRLCCLKVLDYGCASQLNLLDVFYFKMTTCFGPCSGDIFRSQRYIYSKKLYSIFTYLLHGAGVFLEKLTGLQLVKKFPAFHGIRMFITALTSVRQLSLSWASPIRSIYPHPTSWRSVLILSTHLRLGLLSGLLRPCFPTKTLYTPVSSLIRATCEKIKN